ncbi:MAG: hypothetical protein A2340_10370 [Lentisphaerae bacterium RIFOXYB12_FULL_60_10]|nr:MAG: hypothetical protein A2340_10370 [Lentisphaerae bacterium RIFOXYB12_FULL_60_10]
MPDTTQMLPDLQSSLVCDDVRQEHNGKFILIGLFDALAVPAYPAVFQRICVVNRWCCGQGLYHQQSRIIKPDGVSVLVEGKEIPVKLDTEMATATSVEFFVNVRFDAEGGYWVEIRLEGDIKVRYPLRASVLPQPPVAPAPEPGRA